MDDGLGWMVSLTVKSLVDLGELHNTDLHTPDSLKVSPRFCKLAHVA